jgi:hypothetical protein
MQIALIHESINDALREDVQAIGGNKAVGAILWPELPIDQAAGKVRDCMNTDRRERMTPDQLALIVRMARRKGSMAVMRWMAHDAGFAEPVPVEPEDERAKLQRDYIEATKMLAQIANRIDSIPVRSVKAA